MVGLKLPWNVAAASFQYRRNVHTYSFLIYSSGSSSEYGSSQCTLTWGRHEVHLTIVGPGVSCIVQKLVWVDLGNLPHTHITDQSMCSHQPIRKWSQNTTPLPYWELPIGQVGTGRPRRKGLPALQSVMGNSGTPLGYPDLDLRPQMPFLLTTMESIHLREMALHNKLQSWNIAF